MKSNKNARKEKSGATAATSKPTFEIDLTGRFRVRVRALPKALRREVASAIDELRETLGRPHLHTELGIRKLHRNYFECRVGLELRLVFRLDPGLITFTFAGDHDEVRQYARNQF